MKQNENYEKKYKCVLDTARQWIKDGCSDKERICLECCFPELKESKDERIRKEILEDIRNVKAVSSEEYRKKADRWIAWLEKQKENTKNADSIPSDCVSDAKCENRWHKVGDSLPDNGRLVLAQDNLGNRLLARYDGEGNWEVSVYDNEDYYCRNTITKWCEIPSEKQKEQKPELHIELPIDKFGEYLKATPKERRKMHIDEMLKKESIDTLAQKYVDGVKECNSEPTWDLIHTAVCCGYHLAENIRIQPKEQKPVGWSEDFEENIRNLLHDKLTGHSEDGTMTWTTFIDDKTLSDIVNGIWFYIGKEALKYPNKELNVAEWSEDDEKMLSGVIDCVSGWRDEYGNDSEEEIAWLKSLKPQPHWKPSEKQMDFLKDIINEYKYLARPKVVAVLQSLYNNLKEL